jgi:hypothetical protein
MLVRGEHPRIATRAILPQLDGTEPVPTSTAEIICRYYELVIVAGSVPFRPRTLSPFRSAGRVRGCCV